MKRTSLIVAGFLTLGLASRDTVPQQYRASALQSNVEADTVKGIAALKGFITGIEKETVANRNYRRVLYTGGHMQLVLMSLKPGEEIGAETHQSSDQFFRFEAGNGKCIINGKEHLVKAGDAVLVPARAIHNVINTDKTRELKLYTLYAMPVHKDGIVRETKADADRNETKFDGKTTEGVASP